MLPIFGFFLPYIGMRTIPLNKDLTMVDTGKVDLADEVGYYYVRCLVFEWLGFGRPIWQFDGGQVRKWETGELVSEEDVIKNSGIMG